MRARAIDMVHVHVHTRGGGGLWLVAAALSSRFLGVDQRDEEKNYNYRKEP